MSYYAQKLGVKEFELKWERANAVANDRFSANKPHQVRQAKVDMEDCEDIIKGALMSAKCQCGDELRMDHCDVCGKVVIGCMHCHLEAHALELDVAPIFLPEGETVHTSDLQYEGAFHEDEEPSYSVLGEFDIEDDNFFHDIEHYRGKEKAWLKNHAL